MSPRPQSAREAAEFVAQRLREAGCVALFAGGCVRDLLMGREPADYDVATDAVPAKVCSLFRRTLQVGAQFGVVVVVLGHSQVEVATFRSESGYADGRHPEQVRFSDARQDAVRRDFTINGMFLDPAGGEMKVIDYVGGRADLAARVVRAIGVPADRFAEDHLRMLRAVRFACVLNFAIDPATADAVRAHAASIADVSAERIWQEWEKVLAHPNRRAGWALLGETGLLPVLWPDLAALAEPIRRRLELLPPAADAVTALACQFLDLPRRRVHERCRELAMDNDRRESTAWLVEHGRDLLGRTLDVVTLKKLMANTEWPRLVAVAQAIAAAEAPTAPSPSQGEGRGEGATHPPPALSSQSANLHANLSAAEKVPPEKVAPPPLIDGADVMALGVAEGPVVGRVLAAVYDAQLAEAIATRPDALALARRLIHSP